MKIPDIDVLTVTLNPAIDWTVEVPNFSAARVNRVLGDNSRPGGKGINVAAALADYGLRVAATGFIGEENAGLFEKLFAGKGITDRFIRVPGETRTGIKIFDPAVSETTDLNFPGAPPDPAHLQKLIGQIAGNRAPWIVLAGSLPPGMDPAFYGQLMNDCKARGVHVVLDASGAAFSAGLEAGPDVVKPNVEEMQSVLGHPLRDENAVVEAARKLGQRGVGLAVISMGENGACFARRDTVLIARPPRAKVGSSVGAGDAMVAGVVAAQIAGLSLPDSARLATAFSLAILTGQPASREAVEKWIDQVVIETPDPNL